MRKNIFILAFMLLCSMAFAQNKMHFISETPINKGNIVFNVGYEKQPKDNRRHEAPKICLNAGYSFTDWLGAGPYVDFGRNFGHTVMFIGDKNEQGVAVNVYSLEYHSNYLAYGLHVELHPIPLLFPSFYFIDIYAVARAGIQHYICGIKNEWGHDPLQTRESGSLKNAASPYVAGGWGMAVNPFKHFGVFYEGTYNTLTDFYPIKPSSIKKHLYHRFGINIRFGGPKKWQR